MGSWPILYPYPISANGGTATINIQSYQQLRKRLLGEEKTPRHAFEYERGAAVPNLTAAISERRRPRPSPSFALSFSSIHIQLHGPSIRRPFRYEHASVHVRAVLLQDYAVLSCPPTNLTRSRLHIVSWIP